jgi:hypothetical protein
VFRCAAVLVASNRMVRWMFLPHPPAEGNFTGGSSGGTALTAALLAKPIASTRVWKSRFWVELFNRFMVGRPAKIDFQASRRGLSQMPETSVLARHAPVVIIQADKVKDTGRLAPSNAT